MSTERMDQLSDAGVWPLASIGSVCKEIFSGGTPLTTRPEYYMDGDVPWLKTKEVNQRRIYSTENHITQLGLLNSSAKLVPVNSVTVAMYGDGQTAGRVGLTKIPLSTNQACCNLVIDQEKADADFIFYQLVDSYDELVSRKTGSGQQNLNGRLIREFKISLPPLPEQRAVADVLSSLDAKIDLLRRQNQTIEAMAETLFRQWFVEEIDEQWVTCTVGDMLTIRGGTTPSTKEASYWDGDIAWTSPRDLAGAAGVHLFNTSRKITPLGLAQIGSGLLPPGTVLLSSRAPIGYLAITDIPVAINQGYIAMVCDDGIPNYFAYLWCKRHMDDIKAAGNGSTFEEISKSNFKALPFRVPPPEKLEAFDEIAAPLFGKLRCNELQARQLKTLRDALLPKLMNGEVRVAF